MTKTERRVFLRDRAKEGFLTCLFFYLLFLFLEFALPGFVSLFLNPHWVLILGGMFAIVTAVTEKKEGGGRGVLGGMAFAFFVFGITAMLMRPWENTLFFAVVAGLVSFVIFVLHFFQPSYD